MAISKLKNNDTTRQALLDAVHAIVAEQGDTEFSLAKVTEVSGKNAALVSYHFGGKENLLLAALEDDWETAAEQLERLGALEISADEKLRLHIKNMVRLHYERPYFGVLTRVLLRRSSDKSAKILSRKLIEPVVKFQEGLLKQGVESGLFREIEPYAFYVMTIGAVEMYFAAISSARYGFNRTMNKNNSTDFARNLTDMILAAVRNAE